MSRLLIQSITKFIIYFDKIEAQSYLCCSTFQEDPE